MISKFILVEIEGVADNNLEERLVSILEHSTAREAIGEALQADVRLLPATQAIINQREQIQEDIRSILDGLDDEYVERVCQVVVERMNLLVGDEPIVRPEFTRMLEDEGCPSCQSVNTSETTISVTGHPDKDACICDDCGHYEFKY